jgi:SOS response associated peptidase (SRAP)
LRFYDNINGVPFSAIRVGSGASTCEARRFHVKIFDQEQLLSLSCRFGDLGLRSACGLMVAMEDPNNGSNDSYRCDDAGNNTAVNPEPLVEMIFVVKVGFSSINARAETVDKSPAFRDAWKKGQRCLVVTDGFYEWKSQRSSLTPLRWRTRATW